MTYTTAPWTQAYQTKSNQPATFLKTVLVAISLITMSVQKSWCQRWQPYPSPAAHRMLQPSHYDLVSQTAHHGTVFGKTKTKTKLVSAMIVTAISVTRRSLQDALTNLLTLTTPPYQLQNKTAAIQNSAQCGEQIGEHPSFLPECSCLLNSSAGLGPITTPPSQPSMLISFHSPSPACLEVDVEVAIGQEELSRSSGSGCTYHHYSSSENDCSCHQHHLLGWEPNGTAVLLLWE